MGLKKDIFHNTYNEDDEKLPGRTVSIKTQEGGGPAVEYPIAVNKGGTGADTAAAARRNLGLGTVATENTVPVSKGGTGASDADEARRNLGLGTVATENTVPVSKGGTGASDAAAARRNLGLDPVVVPLTPAGMSLPPGVTLHNNNFIIAIGKIRVVNISLKIVDKSGQVTVGNYLPSGHVPRSTFFVTGETGLGDGKLQSATLNANRSLSFNPSNSGTTYLIATGIYVVA